MVAFSSASLFPGTFREGLEPCPGRPDCREERRPLYPQDSAWPQGLGQWVWRVWTESSSCGFLVRLGSLSQDPVCSRPHSPQRILWTPDWIPGPPSHRDLGGCSPHHVDTVPHLHTPAQTCILAAAPGGVFLSSLLTGLTVLVAPMTHRAVVGLLDF